MLSQSDTIAIASGIPGVIALGWQIYAFLHDKAEKQRDKQEALQSELVIVNKMVLSGIRQLPRLTIRVCNRSSHDSIINTAHVHYGIFEEHFRSIGMDSPQPFETPVKPGHHRDFTFGLDDDRARQIEEALRSEEVWISISTAGGTVRYLRQAEIEFFVKEMLSDFKRQRSQVPAPLL